MGALPKVPSDLHTSRSRSRGQREAHLAIYKSARKGSSPQTVAQELCARDSPGGRFPRGPGLCSLNKQALDEGSPTEIFNHCGGSQRRHRHSAHTIRHGIFSPIFSLDPRAGGRRAASLDRKRSACRMHRQTNTGSGVRTQDCVNLGALARERKERRHTKDRF